MNAKPGMPVNPHIDGVTPPSHGDEPPELAVQVVRVSGASLVNYCYVITNTQNQNGLIIDPAWDSSKIKRAVDNSNSVPKGILLTHHHSDHSNKAGKLARYYGADVYMSAPEIDTYQFSCFNLVRIQDSVMSVGGIGFRVIPTPGHTAGSVCYLFRGQIFTGDTLFIEGCGRCAGAGSSPGQMFRSIGLLRASVENDVKVYPGHCFKERPGVPMARVKKVNPYLQPCTEIQFTNALMRRRNTSTVRYI